MVLGVFGAGGFGREVLETVKQIQLKEDRWEKVIFIDDVTTEERVNGVEVVKYRQFKENYGVDSARIFIAIGEPSSRYKLWQLLKADGYTLETIIHPNVWIPDTTKIGEGSYIGGNAFVSCNVTIGDNSLFMPCASIGHDSVVGNHCVCSDMSNIAGNCLISDYCFLGLNSVIKEKVFIARWTIVSLGSAVLRDIEEEEYIVCGVPARKMQQNTEHKVF